MPPKPQPKTYILLLKTHKLTAFLTRPQVDSVDSLKIDALSALQSDVLDVKNPHLSEDYMEVDSDAIPKVASVEDFELCRAVREKGRPTGEYEVLDGDAQIKNVLVNWENVFVRFKDEKGQLLPVNVSLFSVHDDEEEADSAARKGKRKATAESP